MARGLSSTHPTFIPRGLLADPLVQIPVLRPVNRRPGTDMLRHSLANQGVDTRSLQHYLGHKNIQHTVRYTELAPDRFKNFWR